MRMLLSLLFMLLPSAAYADAAIGYGAAAVGGTTPCVVSTLGDNVAVPPTGSLRECLAAPGNLITFSVTGTITLRDTMDVPSNTYIDGGDQIILLAGPFDTFQMMGDNTNIVIRNLSFRHKYSAGSKCLSPAKPTDTEGCGSPIAMRDAGAHDIWIDNDRFYGCGAKCIYVWNAATDVTVSESNFRGPGMYGMLIGGGSGVPGLGNMRVTMYRNYFTGMLRRNPKVTALAHLHFFNNVVENWGPDKALDFGTGSSGAGQLLAENNIFIRGSRSSLSGLSVREGSHINDALGYLKAVGNRMMNGARGASNNPGAVFTPAYEYTLSVTSDTLLADVRR